MATEAELETNVLEFNRKSFGFERTVSALGREFALFARTETESESKLRPKLLRLRVAIPAEWLIYDAVADLLVIAIDGSTPGRRAVGPASETAVEKSEFSEQGVDWKRMKAPDGSFLYTPAPLAAELTSPEGLRALGLA
ncbi:MAG TPA: hypothetical protein VFF67_06685 [Thermoplasmata archaeon]|nr:hypothetical protein [Thermoplasmata archaeon]